MEQRFRYGARPAMLVVGAAFFGAGGAFFLHAASTGAQVRVWPLSIYVTGAPVYVFAAASFAFVLAAAAQIVRHVTLPARALVIADEYLEAPRGPWSRATVRIKRANVRAFRENEVMGTRVVVIETKKKKVSLSNRTVGEDGYAATMRWLRR